MLNRIYDYKQKYWSYQIASYLELNNSLNPIIDTCCGSGITTNWLSKFTAQKVIGVDNHHESVAIARSNFNNSLVQFYELDVFLFLKKLPSVPIICNINSLFCLNDPEKFINLSVSKLNKQGLLFFILPNISSQRYIHWHKNNKSMNKLELSLDEYKPFFNSFGLEVKDILSSLYVSSYDQSKKFKLRFPLSMVKQEFLYLRNKYTIDNKNNLVPNYYLVVTKKFN